MEEVKKTNETETVGETEGAKKEKYEIERKHLKNHIVEFDWEQPYVEPESLKENVIISFNTSDENYHKISYNEIVINNISFKSDI